MMHAVDSRFLIADDGRIIFRTAGQFVVIPEPDLGLVRRRNMQANVVGILAVLLSNLGLPRTYWQPWWLLAGIGVWIAAYFWTGRWVRERYGTASDPRVAVEVRQAIARNIKPHAVGSELASAALSLLVVALTLIEGKPRPMMTILLMASLGHLFGAFQKKRLLESADAEPHQGITR